MTSVSRSDAVGRRPLFALAFVLAALGPLSFWASQAFGISLYLFFAGKFLAQLAPLGVVVLSFVADVTTRAERSLAFSLVIGAFGLVFQAINLAALVGSSGTLL
jgi:hypothetical protein